MSKNNTLTRVLVSLVAIPMILLLIWLGGFFFMALSLGIAVNLGLKKGVKPLLYWGYVAVMAIVLNAYYHVTDFQVLSVLVILSTVLIELFRNRGSAILNLGVTFLGIFYVGYFISAIVEIREYFQSPFYIQGAYMIFSVMASIWICDSAAFFGGITLGRHKMFPRVSPKKSWEGAAFGFVFSVAAMIAAQKLILDFISFQDAVIIGIIVGTVGQMGDLAESLLKRDAGVKDSSNIIPGHGGIFDRFDSLIAVAPLVFVYLKIFVNN
ncbi:MAG: phosphatidate cytidylyltransferase [Ignavibacteriales bacterium]|nr:phosphatidate cytidylyltransferase [Ignavibacteriales bacterium]